MTTLNIGKQAFNTQDVANKVQSDILFLESRIALLQQQPNPNPMVVQTYEQMLESRQAVLGWLQQNEVQVALDKLG
ncbi:hypothetical protein CBP51_11975 [Cellvibrio mixtus]|uniref:Uncharacterized protein n=1 Tax=Cellvibrio mixtus TaxID=39650 RepID=A0A266QE60_9GAMM|nr:MULTISPECIES: hypothetical protein [Cellvibrio]AQT61361.1 hypothetical protein B0D95_15520 [Cellvibrio sp. PSBB023]OZY87649.1 hypothetical protein CBP51_11975 [Cellvibrio mixtus]